MYPTKFHKASSPADAVARLSAAEDGTFLAGGQTLLPTMKQRLAQPSDLISLAGAGLSGISMLGDTLVIGATTTHAEVAASSEVQSALPALAALAGGIGDPAVRHRGTIGGSLANNDPAADYPAAVLALGACVVTDRREIVADAFFDGLFGTALDENEIITAVKFPTVDRAAYVKFRNPASRFALVGVFVAVLPDGVRVAVTGAGEDGVFRHSGLEAALAADFDPRAVDGVHIEAEGLMSDIHGDGAYRAGMIKVMARRAVAAAR